MKEKSSVEEETDGSGARRWTYDSTESRLGSRGKHDVTNSGFFRKGSTVSDVRPPPPPAARPSLGLCDRCGEYVLTGEGLDGAKGPLRHFVCDPAIRSGIAKKVEAMRSLHRAVTALASLPDVQRGLEADLAALPDAIDLGDALAALERARTHVECTSFDQPEQRRLALSYLDTTLRKLKA